MGPRAWLAVDPDFDPAVSIGVGVHGADPGLMLALDRYTQGGGRLRSIFRVIVTHLSGSRHEELPAMLGRYQRLADGVRFIPRFPFERGLSYLATFDFRPFWRGRPEVLKLGFSLPSPPKARRPEVKTIFPSSDQLPENILRFYVCFSNPMQRGHAEAEISVIGPDGAPAPDVLYRAPVELWDRGMRRLTILLDPGRLKRGVGPNRDLGPPLRTGHAYTLIVGSGMTDLHGGRLAETSRKRFVVTEAVREPVAIERWALERPTASSCQPLEVMFQRPLDWALLSNAIAITSSSGEAIEGRIDIDEGERRWRFTPTNPWRAGSYRVRVASSLEDVCGNSLVAPFDRLLRPDLPYQEVDRSIRFHLD